MKQISLVVLLFLLHSITAQQAPNNASAARPAELPFEFVEQMPQFPGGDHALYKYIRMNLRYPPAAKDKGIQGKVLIKFVIDKQGSVINAQVVKGIGTGCDEEALRVISGMPQWKPGIHKGEPVNVYYTIPVAFKLN